MIILNDKMASPRTKTPGTPKKIMDLTELNRKLEVGDITPAEHSKEFAKLRGLVGGSTAAKITGNAEFGTAREMALATLYPEKFAKEPTTYEQFMFDFGHFFEKPTGLMGATRLAKELGKEYSNKAKSGNGVFFEECPFQFGNSNWPNCIGNIDGILWIDGKPWLAEIKTTVKWSNTWQHIQQNQEAPPWYRDQIMFYLMLLPFLEGAFLITWAIDRSEDAFAVIQVPRDDAYGEEIMRQCEIYAENLKKGIIPDDSTQNPKAVARSAAKIYKEEDPTLGAVTIPPERKPAFDRLAAINDEKTKILEEKDLAYPELAELSAKADEFNAASKEFNKTSEGKAFAKRIKALDDEKENICLSLLENIGNAPSGVFETETEKVLVKVKRGFSKDAETMAMLKSDYPFAYEALENYKPNIKVETSVIEKEVKKE